MEESATRYLVRFPYERGKGKVSRSRTSNLLDCFERTDVCRNRYELPVSPVITRNKASFSRAFIANRVQTCSPFASLLETAMLFTRYKIRRETSSLLLEKDPFASDSREIIFEYFLSNKINRVEYLQLKP